MSPHLLLSLFPLLLLFPLPSFATTIGATYTLPQPPSRQLSPSSITNAVTTTLRLGSLRLPDPSPSLIRSFSFTNTTLFLSIPNPFLSPLASNRSMALRWVYGHVLPFYPRSKITLISVGNDAISPDLYLFLLPAIRNLRLSLLDLGIRTIRVSTTFSFGNLIASPFPPSSATFQEPLGQLIIQPLLQFLDATNSSFLVNIYPYNMYRVNSEIPLGFALFQDHAFNFRDDVVTGVRYKNLFDMMVDAVVTSLAVMGHENTPIVVAETGWPSSSSAAGEVEANRALAEMYLKGLVRHLKYGEGTPLKKEGVAGAYVYELVDENTTSNGVAIRNWGILYPNLSRKYEVEFFTSEGGEGDVMGKQKGRCRKLLVGSMLLFVIWMLLGPVR